MAGSKKLKILPMNPRQKPKKVPKPQPGPVSTRMKKSAPRPYGTL